MELNKISRKIGKRRFGLGCLSLWIILAIWVQAAQLEFSATIDSSEVGVGEPFVLTLTLKSDGNSAGEPSFKAPDFDVAGQQSAISFVGQLDSQSGETKMMREQAFQVTLIPRKRGQFKISQIQMKMSQQVLTAPDIQVKVVSTPTQASRGTHLARPSTGLMWRAGGLQPRMNRVHAGSKRFVKAEVDRSQAYKGQKVIVSYYLYHQPRLLSVQVDKFPSLTGFLREDLVAPAMGQSPESQEVKLNGEVFERSLIARYATYPVSEGLLTVDPIGVRYQYVDGSRRSPFGWGDEDDALMSFFNPLSRREGAGTSEPVTIQVLPLPAEGRPEDFSGGVGEFNLLAMVDKYEVRANEPINLTLKVEGNGNLTALQAPHGKWPSQVELYEERARALVSQGGSGAQVFEYLLIPRATGQLVLPPIKMSFFDPEKKTYYTRATESIEVRVLEPLPGSAPVPPKTAGSANLLSTPPSPASAVKIKGDDPIRGWLPPEKQSNDSLGLPVWRYLFWTSLLAFLYLLGWIVWDDAKSRRTEKSASLGEWKRLRSLSADAMAQASFQNLVRDYAVLREVLMGAVEENYSISAKAISRSELRAYLLAQEGFTQDVWSRLNRILEFTDLVCFAGTQGAVSEELVRKNLKEMIQESEYLIQEMKNHRKAGKNKALVPAQE